MNKRSFLLILALMVSAVFVFAAACSPAAEDDPTVAPVSTSTGADTESSSGGSGQRNDGSLRERCAH